MKVAPRNKSAACPFLILQLAWHFRPQLWLRVVPQPQAQGVLTLKAGPGPSLRVSVRAEVGALLVLTQGQ